MLPLISEAHAQAASDGMLGGLLGNSPLAQFLPFIGIFVLGYFMILRPQQQEQKKLKARLAAVKRGDRVLTAGGIIGVVQKSRDGVSELEVEIAPNVRVTVLRETLTNVLTAPAPEAK